MEDAFRDRELFEAMDKEGTAVSGIVQRAFSAFVSNLSAETGFIRPWYKFVADEIIVEERLYGLITRIVSELKTWRGRDVKFGATKEESFFYDPQVAILLARFWNANMNRMAAAMSGTRYNQYATVPEVNSVTVQLYEYTRIDGPPGKKIVYMIGTQIPREKVWVQITTQKMSGWVRKHRTETDRPPVQSEMFIPHSFGSSMAQTEEMVALPLTEKTTRFPTVSGKKMPRSSRSPTVEYASRGLSESMEPTDYFVGRSVYPVEHQSLP